MKAVTLDDILVGAQRVEIPVPSKNVAKKDGTIEPAKLVYYARPARQAERDLAASAARNASRKLRKLLETEGTEERQLLVLDELEGASIDSLKALWVQEKVVERAVKIRQDSLEDRDQTYIPEPEGDGITSKDIDDYENAVEEAEDNRELSVVQIVEMARKELEEQVETISEDKLMELAIAPQIDSILGRTYETEFALQLIYRCTFKDRKCTKRAFEDMETVYALKDYALTKLSNAHMSMLIDPERVKNLAGGLKSSI